MANNPARNKAARLSGSNPLAYLGVDPLSPPDLIAGMDRSPTENDNAALGALWTNEILPATNPRTFQVWMCVAKHFGGPNKSKWILMSSGSGAGSVISLSPDTDDSPITPDSNGNINIHGSLNITTEGDFSDNSIRVLLDNTVILGSTPDNVTGDALTLETGNLTLQATNGTGNINLPITNAAGTAGIITYVGTRFIHAFGNLNTFVGAGSGNTTLTPGSAIRNCSLGTNTLGQLTTGTENVAIGPGALGFCTTGSSNIAIGDLALNIATTAETNIAIGIDSMIGNLSGSNNIAIGQRTLDAITTGNFNIAIGDGAGMGLLNTDESNNILIGNSGALNDNNAIKIGDRSTHTSCFIQGIDSATVTGSAVLVDITTGQLGLTTSSAKFKMNIKDMGSESDGLMKLRPVTFNYKEDANLNKQYGLIAEEVAQIIPEIVVYDSNHDPYSVQYHQLPVLLLNEIQKLRKEIDNLKKVYST